MAETRTQFTHDIMLGAGYLVVAIFAGWRTYIYFEPKGSGKVITVFYIMLLLSSLSRAIWFLIPSDALEDNYVPTPAIAFQSHDWKGLLLSEVFVTLGSLSLYGVFLLIICYWDHMLYKVKAKNQQAANQATIAHQVEKKKGPMYTFVIYMSVFLLLEVLNIVFYMLQLYNSQAMILYDSILYAIISTFTLLRLSRLSQEIRSVLATIGIINAKSTDAQVKRILAMTVAANIFLLIRVVIEVVNAVALVILFSERKPFVQVSTEYWNFYILGKHWSEVIILTLLLIISTAIKPSTNASRNIRHTRRPHPQEAHHQEITEMTPLKSVKGGPGLVDI